MRCVGSGIVLVLALAGCTSGEVPPAPAGASAPVTGAPSGAGGNEGSAQAAEGEAAAGRAAAGADNEGSASAAGGGEVSRPGGPASHDGCSWRGVYLGRYGSDVPDVGDELVTVRLDSDDRWFVESGTSKVRGRWTRSDDTLTIIDTMTVGAGTACGETPGRYLLRHTNDCATAALTVDEDACEARATRLHGLVLERR